MPTVTAPPAVSIDLDSHEMVPMHMWEDTFGPEVLPLADATADLLSRIGENSFVRPDIEADDMEITESVVWNEKGPHAPGAIDMHRRTEVLQVMGIQRQFVFPSMALTAMVVANNPDASTIFGFDPNEVDAATIGRAAIGAHNEWVARMTKQNAQAGVVPVGLLLTDTFESMMRQAEQALAEGVRVFWLPSGVPPANTSPADKALDPLWALLAGANAPVLAHLGTEFALISGKWHANVPEFVQGTNSSVEFPIEPFRSATLNLANETMLSAMILGGVLERHPTLRVGVIECGAQWVGPLSERLDTWSEQFDKRLANTLSMRPSEYLARNVRVTPFVFEKVSTYFERWPNLADVFAYSSDYPHREGGRESKRRFFEEIVALGDDVVQKFFYDNGTLLLPG